ncbi:MAG TPA: glycosyltransferase family 4 protein [Verrucomicrobiae bacterium]|nr:glycosyltransferase family 4 protein [Verrucomicrobiae bacterium]
MKHPTRILMTADSIGGVWTYALELAAELGNHGIEVAMATMGAPLSAAQRREAVEISNLEVFESGYKLEWMENPWIDVAAAGDWLLSLEETVKPDVIHLNGYAHGSLPWSAPCLLVAHSCVLSWWRAVHECEAPEEWNPYREAVRAGMAGADLVVAPSQAMLASIERDYAPLPPAIVIPNGRKLPAVALLPKEEFILSAGRLWDEAKNIQALAGISGELPWPVFIAGEQRNPSRQNASSSGPGSLHALGKLSAAELLPWFQRASIYALPARYEPFGLSAIEAALCGCPLVLGDLSSLREIWGDAAIFVPPQDSAALKAALLDLIHSPALRSELGRKARTVALRHTPERMAFSYLEAYRSLLAVPDQPEVFAEMHVCAS